MSLFIDNGVSLRFQVAFDLAERAAFADRQAGVTRPMPEGYTGEAARGWNAGYWPRSAAWALRQPEPAPRWSDGQRRDALVEA